MKRGYKLLKTVGKMTAESMHIKIKDLEETDKTEYKGNE